MLGMTTTFDEAREYFNEAIVNNMDVKGDLKLVEEYLKQRFKRSQKYEEESTKKEVFNFQLGKNTAQTMDKLERLRSKIGASLCKKESEKAGAAKDTLDKWLLRDFLEKSKEKVD